MLAKLHQISKLRLPMVRMANGQIIMAHSAALPMSVVAIPYSAMRSG